MRMKVGPFPTAAFLHFSRKLPAVAVVMLPPGPAERVRGRTDGPGAGVVQLERERGGVTSLGLGGDSLGSRPGLGLE